MVLSLTTMVSSVGMADKLLQVTIAMVFCVTTIDVISGHGTHHRGDMADKPAGFHDDKVVQDKEHIGEHLEGIANLNVSSMSPGELEFHYFKLHDFDNNSMLDGLEIYKALTHLLPYDELDLPKVDPAGKTADQVINEQRDEETKYYTEIVDTVLEEDDLNNDGLLTYTEYLIARHREEYNRKKEELIGKGKH